MPAPRQHNSSMAHTKVRNALVHLKPGLPGAVESGRKFVESRDEKVVGEGNDHVIMQRIACGIVVALRRVYLIIHERDVATPAGGGGVPRIPYSAFPVHV